MHSQASGAFAVLVAGTVNANTFNILNSSDIIIASFGQTTVLGSASQALQFRHLDTAVLDSGLFWSTLPPQTAGDEYVGIIGPQDGANVGINNSYPAYLFIAHKPAPTQQIVLDSGQIGTLGFNGASATFTTQTVAPKRSLELRVDDRISAFERLIYMDDTVGVTVKHDLGIDLRPSNGSKLKCNGNDISQTAWTTGVANTVKFAGSTANIVSQRRHRITQGDICEVEYGWGGIGAAAAGGMTFDLPISAAVPDQSSNTWWQIGTAMMIDQGVARYCGGNVLLDLDVGLLTAVVSFAGAINQWSNVIPIATGFGAADAGSAILRYRI